MKRPVKLFIFLVITISIVIIGGKILNKEKYKQQLIDEEGPRIEKYLKYNYKGIKEVTFTEVKINPTGIPHIKGYVNNDKKMTFSAGIYDEHYTASLSWNNDEKAPQAKFEDKNRTVPEIEKEEQSQNKATQ